MNFGKCLHRTLEACAFLGMLVALQPAHAQIVGDGGFETPVVAGSFSTFNAGNTFGSWTVFSGNVDLIKTLWDPHSGNQSLDLNGSAPGTIYQDLTTTIGQSYTLSFWMAGNPDGAPSTKSLTVNFGGTSVQTFTFDTTGHSDNSMGWRQRTISVTGSGSDRLIFSSNTVGSFGPALDDVSLTSNVTPEPGSIALFASMSVAGIGIVSRRLRRRA